MRDGGETQGVANESYIPASSTMETVMKKKKKKKKEEVEDEDEEETV